jgi:cell division septation protein DedD
LKPPSQASAPKAGVPPSIAAQPPAQASSGKPAPAKEAAPASAAQSAAKPGSWIVQITALQDRGACVAIAQRLVAKGYPAFVMDPAAGSPKIYRVQVGGYPDREKADQAARRLATEEQFKTYVRSR